jgi:site-specific DNA recombinase
MRIFHYLRYSSANQAGGVSCELQRAAIARYIQANPTWKGVPIIERRDEAKTGTTFAGREGFASILREVQPGDVLIIFKYDRLGRTVLESLQHLEHLEKERGVAVYSATEPNTEVVRNLLLTMAQEYSRQLSQRCKGALDAIAAAGFASNKPAYGYKTERQPNSKRKKYVVVPEEAAVVRRIFELRAKGTACRAIARTLTLEGIACPNPKRRAWCHTGVRALLKNQVYLGMVISGMRLLKKGKRGPGSAQKRPRSEWKVCENAHEAIIDRKIWEAVRAFDRADYHGHKATPYIQHQYLWTGTLRCSECGGNLTRLLNKGQAWYGCDNGRKSGLPRPCNQRYLVREDVIAGAVLTAMKEQLYGLRRVEQIVRLVREEVIRATKSTGEVLDPLESSLARLTRQVEAAERGLVRVPEDSQPVFLDELRKLKAERDDLRTRIEHLRATVGAPVDLDALEGAVRGRLQRLWMALGDSNIQTAREELARHVLRIEVAPDREAKLYPRPEGLLAVATLDGRLVLSGNNTAPASDAGEGGVGIDGIPDEI